MGFIIGDDSKSGKAPPKDYIYWPFEKMPKFFPLEKIRLGHWSSELHLNDQLFVLIDETRFIYVVVHPEKQTVPA